MEEQNGITLITLVITIIVMIIITGVATYSGVESINSTKRMAFISELEMIQAKVNTIYEKRKTSIEQKNYYDNLGSSINTLDEGMILEPLGGTSKEGFRYFSRDNLKQLDLANINQDVIINFDTREVISLTGFKIDNKMCYKLSNMPGYSKYNVEYKNNI